METVRKGAIDAGLDEIRPLNLNFKILNEHIAIYNQSIIGLANGYRVGDVVVTATLFSSKFRSAFAIYNVSSDADIVIQTSLANYSNGHIHMDCNSVMATQVFMLEYLSQSLTLDEFQLTMGDCVFSVTGLGDRAQDGSAMMTEIFANMKDPVLLLFSILLKTLLNSALAVATEAGKAGVMGLISGLAG